MTSMNFIAIGVIFVFAAVIIGIRLYQNRNKKITMDEFIDTYGDNIVKALQDAVRVLKIEMDDFNSREEYEKTIINTTILSLKNSASQFGIPDEIINLIDTDSLTSIIANCFNENKLNCIDVLGSKTIESHKDIIDPAVVLKSKNRTSPN